MTTYVRLTMEENAQMPTPAEMLCLEQTGRTLQDYLQFTTDAFTRSVQTYNNNKQPLDDPGTIGKTELHTKNGIFTIAFTSFHDFLEKWNKHAPIDIFMTVVPKERPQ